MAQLDITPENEVNIIAGTYTAEIGSVGDVTAHGAITAVVSGADYGLGGVTAHGTITANAKGTVTAEVKGTLTAEVKGTLTAQVASPLTALISGNGFGLGGVTAHGLITALLSGNNFALGNVTAGGQITAHGTVTAEAKGTITAEAKGTVTAEVKGTLTAQIQNQPVSAWGATAGWLVSGVNAIGTGSAIGMLTEPYGFAMAFVSGNSASGDLLASIDSANWFSVTSWALGPGQTGTAQFSGYYPYLAGQVKWVSAEGAASGTFWLRYASPMG